jgi:hypothetical protein
MRLDKKLISVPRHREAFGHNRLPLEGFEIVTARETLKAVRFEKTVKGLDRSELEE